MSAEDATSPSLISRLNKRASLLQLILSFHDMNNPKHYINLRSSSKFFYKALHQPPPLWTSFPHSKHDTLQSLINHLEELHDDEESSNGNIPSLLFIEKGEYSFEELRSADYSCYDTGAQGLYVTVKKPLSIYGAGAGKTTLVGVGLMIHYIQENKKTNDIVYIHDLTIHGGKGSGLYANNGMKVITRGLMIENCQVRNFSYFAARYYFSF